MKADETVSNGTPHTACTGTAAQVSGTTSHAAKFTKVRDGRKQPIRGLWVRNGRYYARLAVENESGEKETRRIPLEGCSTVAEAVAAKRKLETQREENDLPVLKMTPKLKDFQLEYFKTFETRKRLATVQKEKGAMKLWVDHMGETRLNKITRAQINSFITKRQTAGKSGRTVNLDVIALRNVLKHAQDNGWIKALPMQGMRPLKFVSPKRALVTLADIEAICNAALEVSKNGQQLVDYIKLMAFCGSRRNETLRLKWSDVNWDLKQITIGADGLSKNGEHRAVDFNEKLEAHLLDMQSRRAPDSDWLFPSPQRGKKDIHAKTFKQSLELALEHLQKKTGKAVKFGFHDCRHFFISYSVMSGIDYMTIARWVSHKDGGVLIGKVYGHLANDHAKQQARKLSFGPVMLAQEA